MRFLTWLQGLILALEFLSHWLFLKWIFKVLGVPRYFIVNTNSSREFNHFITDANQILREAVDIKLCGGELGYRFMEHPLLLEAIDYAHKTYGTVPEIIHSSIVDPKTKSIFDFARKGKAKLMMTDQNRHHFLIITNSQGEITIIDENVHNETLWAGESEATAYEIYTSKYHIYHILKRSYILRRHLENTFRQKKSMAKNTPLIPEERPNWSHNYKHLGLAILLNSISTSPFKFAYQPLEVFIDSLLSKLYYKENIMKEKRHFPKIEEYEEYTEAKVGSEESVIDQISRLRIDPDVLRILDIPLMQKLSKNFPDDLPFENHTKILSILRNKSSSNQV